MKMKWRLLIVLALLITLVSGITPARAQSETTYSISGQVFYDDNGNGILDGAEQFTYFGDTVHLDQGCDGTVDAEFTMTYYVQTYTFANLPAGQSYCLRYYYPGYRTTTPDPVTTSLASDMTGVNIGFEYVWLNLSVSPPIQAPVNAYFERTIAVTGGDAPYSFTNPVTVPAPGLTAAYNSDGSIFISGTPTQPGEYSFVVDVTDGNGAHKQETVTLWVQVMPVIEFTSTPDPWVVGEPVTFTFGLVNPDHLTFAGTVTLYAGGIPIQDCREEYSDPSADPFLYLYDYSGTGWGFKNPVTCTTTLASLEPIAATYTGIYGAFQSGSTTLEPTSYSISGTVFNDINGDGFWDTGEAGLGGAYVDIDAQCTGQTAFSIFVNSDGSYSLTGVPSGACVVLSGRHPADMYVYGWKQTTPVVRFDSLSQHQTGVNIGLQEYSLDYTPKSGPPDFLQALPDGQLNQAYSATITVFGGVPPYYHSMGSEGNLPLNGLEVFMDELTGVITISGTPTEAGRYTLDMYVNDVNGVVIEVQGHFFVKTDATFSLTSSATPSNFGDPVTFSLSASGTVVPYLPHGLVTFKADGVMIAGCDHLILGYDELGNYTNPVQCTTSALTAGAHVITADFASGWGPYNDATVTLEGGQIVLSANAADLSLTKIDSKDPVKPGDKLVYTLTVSNLGPSTAESVVLSDKLDSNTTYGSVSAPKGWQCSYAKNSATVTCTSASMASGGSATIKITVTVNKTAKAGKELVNTAQVSSAIHDPDMANNSVTQKTMVLK
jgi:uncharacterized repeat protein (TIGR01451 family)